MPEIKQNFTSGKMNKDLDERLVPKGEYRHAMNVQVSTSDGSNVGSLQNILGNNNVTTYISNGSNANINLPASSKTIGVYAHEPDDAIYWFVTSPTQDLILVRSKNAGSTTYSVKKVFCDTNKDILRFPSTGLITAINKIDDLLFWTDNENEPRMINVPVCINNTTQFGVPATSTTGFTQHDITVIKKGPRKKLSLELKTHRPLSQTAAGSGFPLSYTGVITTHPTGSSVGPNADILQYHPWYDPTSTLLSVRNFENTKIGDVITVRIKEDIDGNSDFELEWIKGITGGGGSQSTTDAKWKGQRVALKEYSDPSTPPRTPINAYTIKGVLTNYIRTAPLPTNLSLIRDSSAVFGARDIYVQFEVTSVNGIPNAPETGATLKYAIDLFDETEKLFEFKFPRFSFRYKYMDGQYSPFGPWTEVAFVPGSFDYHPKKGFNLGMTNRLSSVVVSDYLVDMPNNVKEIDILYKEEGDTSVYVVETISQTDEHTITVGPNTYNHWTYGSYEVLDETIYRILPTNQSIRPWDNVPVQAKSQSVVGNRIVYGNYKQGRSIDTAYPTVVQGNITNWSTVEQYKPRINASVLSRQPGKTGVVQSIKSLREYQIGVLFVDFYGRETPVLTHPDATFKLEKDAANTANRLKLSLQNLPQFVDPMFGYKFFIKETADEYYNLAMDRWWDAGDGNRWLSFPSSDRNKVDIDTFIILKKANESSSLIVEPARYNILAIENEAPDYIKQNQQFITMQTHDTSIAGGAGDLFGSAPGVADTPIPGNKELVMAYSGFFDQGTGVWLHDIEEGELYVEFGLVGTSQRTNRYKISELTKTGTGSSESYNIVLETPIGSDANFITDDITGQSITTILDGVQVRVYHYKVENKAKFDGRFFVKIFADDVFKENFESNPNLATKNYRVVYSQTKYSMFDNHNTTHAAAKTGLDQGNYAIDSFGAFSSFFRCHGAKSNDHLWWTTATGQSANNQAATADPALGYPVGEYAFHTETSTRYNPNSAMNVTYQANALNYTYPSWWREYLQRTGWTGNAWPTQPGTSDYYDQDQGNNMDERSPLDITEARNAGEDGEVWFVDAGPYAGINLVNQQGQGGDLAFGNVNAGNSTGIVDLATGGSLISVSLGPIYISDQGTTGTTAAGGSVAQTDFWNIGTASAANTHYADQNTINWVSNYNVGSQFVWREDLDQTVYTITDVTERGYLNYEGDDDTTQPPLHGMSINKRKNWYITVEPEMAFKPFSNGTYGFVPGGARIGINATTGFGGLTYNNNTAGNLENYRIYLETNKANSTSTSHENVYLQPGWILYAYDNGSTVLGSTYGSTTPILLVKKVHPVSAGYYRVDLCGYIKPLDAAHCITPTSGQLVYFAQALMNGYSRNSARRLSLKASNDESDDLLRAVGYNMDFVREVELEGELPENPAVWETEPKDESKLDIYHEISDYIPLSITPDNAHIMIPIGSTVTVQPGTPGSLGGVGVATVTDNTDSATNVAAVTPPLFQTYSGFPNVPLFPDQVCIELDQITTDMMDATTAFPNNSVTKLIITKPNGERFRVECMVTPTSTWGDQTTDGNGTAGSSLNWANMVQISSNAWGHELNWHNCYSFLNGVESNRIRDSFNLPFISNGFRVSTVFDDEIKSERLKSGLIYSGLYNSTSSINNLNQFIQAEKITKNVNPIYGSIQKLHTRDSDLIALCENKILKILANKDAVFNADGNINLTATENVLGQTVPFVGEYGISKNPESFASESYRAYFTDKKRGVVMRLSRDGLTPISDHGMRDWFRDNLGKADYLIGSYDSNKKEYNLKLDIPFPTGTTNESKVLSFKEDVKGWVSFKSFVDMLFGVSSNNDYFTFKGGKIWQHHVEITNTLTGIVDNYNTFYNQPSHNSEVVFLLNDFPSSVKSFKTINYEGTRTKIDQLAPGAPGVTDIHGNTINPPAGQAGWDDHLHYNETAADGWWCYNIETDLERGAVPEFIKKEGKYFNYIRGQEVEYNSNWEVQRNFDTGSLNIQGVGRLSSVPTISDVFGCTCDGGLGNGSAPANDCYNDGIPAFNYDSAATINATSPTDSTSPCIEAVFGCTDPTAHPTSYNPQANTDDGSCVYTGCMDDGIVSFNFQNSNFDPQYINDPTPLSITSFNNYSPSPGLAANNIDLNANTPCGITAGDIGINSPNPANNTTNGCCTYSIIGCTDPLAINYDANANTPCDAAGTGISLVPGSLGECCVPEVFGCTDPIASNYNSTATTEDASCLYPGCTDNTTPATNFITQNSGPIDATSFPASFSPTVGYGYLQALAGEPTQMFHMQNTYGNFDGGLNQNWDACCTGGFWGTNCWGFAPGIFGLNGSGATSLIQTGVGVLTPLYSQSGNAGSCEMNIFIDNAQFPTTQSAHGGQGCDPTIPYEAVINTGASTSSWITGLNIQTAYSTTTPNPLGNYPPYTEDPNNLGTYLPTWPDIQYAVDVQGNQIPFSHEWWTWDPGLGAQTDPLAYQWNPLQHVVNPYPPCANDDDGSCTYDGCPDPIAANYVAMSTATTNVGCLYCGDATSPRVRNYDGALDAQGNPYLAGCEYCPPSGGISNKIFNTNYTALNPGPWAYNATGSTIDISFDFSTGNDWNNPTNIDSWLQVFFRTAAVGNTPAGQWTQRVNNTHADLTATSSNSYSAVWTDGGFTPNTVYDMRMKWFCGGTNAILPQSQSTTGANFFYGVTTAPPMLDGCMDSLAINYCSSCTAQTNPNICSYEGCMLADDFVFAPTATNPCAGNNGAGAAVGLASWESSNIRFGQHLDSWNNSFNGISQTAQNPTSLAWNLGAFPGVGSHQNHTLPNTCCLFIGSAGSSVGSGNPLDFGGNVTVNGVPQVGVSAYYGCLDPNAFNYCNGCQYDVVTHTDLPYCQYSGGCHSNAVGDNPDVNGYCSDATFDILNSHKNQAATYLPNVGTFAGVGNTGGCPGIGYLSTNFDPMQNFHDENNTSGCTYTGCTAPGCSNPGVFAGMPTVPCVGILDPNITLNAFGPNDPWTIQTAAQFHNFGINEFGTSGGSSSVNTTNQTWEISFYAAQCSSAQGCTDYKKLCRLGNSPQLGSFGPGCSQACFDANQVADPALVGTQNGHHIPAITDNGVCAATVNQNVQYVPFGASTAQSFSGLYYKFEWIPGTATSDWSITTTPVFLQANIVIKTLIVPLSVAMQGWNSSTGNITFDPTIWGEYIGPLGNVSPPDLFTPGTTVNWGIYKECQNGTEKKVAGTDLWLINPQGQNWY